MIPELWNVYDYDRNDTGRLVSRGIRMQPDEYHLVVNVWLKNAQGEYLISQRSPAMGSSPCRRGCPAHTGPRLSSPCAPSPCC